MAAVTPIKFTSGEFQQFQSGDFVSIASGGTGQTSCVAGDIIQGSGVNTTSKLASVASGSFLRSGGVTTVSAWSTMTLPNTITSGSVLIATGTNAVGESSNLTFSSTTKTLTVTHTDPANYAINSSCLGLTGTSVTGCFFGQVGTTSASTTKIMARFDVGSAGAATSAGFGQYFLFMGYNAAGSAFVEMGRLGTNWTNSSNNGRVFLSAATGGTSSDILSVSSSGAYIIPGQANTSVATAYLHLGAGTATASTAPLKFTSGTNLTTAEAGAMEYNGTNLFFTRTGTTRETVMCSNAVNTVSPTAQNRTITVVIAGTTFYLTAKTTND